MIKGKKQKIFREGPYRKAAVQRDGIMGVLDCTWLNMINYIMVYYSKNRYIRFYRIEY